MSSKAQLLAPVDIVGGQDSVSHSLRVLASVYNYNHWIFSMIRDHLGTSVLEIGAGIGNITKFMLNVEKLVCLEPFEPYRDYLVRRFSEHHNVRVVGARIEECPNGSVRANEFDSIVCLNVLEHIENDYGALQRCHDLLIPGGRMVVFVPALPSIYGAMDKAMGHVRRYTRRTLAKVFVKAGLEPESAVYMNFAGILGWWLQGRLRGKATISETGTRLFDRLVPYLSAVERLVPPILGQSLIMVGKKANVVVPGE